MPLVESMLLTLKNNKSLKRLKIKIKKPFIRIQTKSTSLYHFPEATPELLEKIRLQMVIQNKEETISYLISLVIVLLLFLFLIL